MEVKERCKHCMGLTINSLGETICSCELYGEDEGRNVTLGECFGNCNAEEAD